MKGNLTRYGAWQLRDFIRDRGIALLLVGLLMGVTFLAPVKAVGREIDANLAKEILSALLQQVSFVLAFIALNGIISTDRKMGYYRFLFSKPVSITAYYSQLFVVFLVGYLAACAVLIGIFAIFARPVSPFAPLAFCALVFLSFGGIAFLISSLVRYDWPVLGAVLLGSSILHALWQYKEGWRRMVLSVLPPMYHLTDALPGIMTTGTVNTNNVLWLLGYSAICFALGLFVLKRRPFA